MEGLTLYAYRQQIQQRQLHIVPQYNVERVSTAPKVLRKKRKTKKINPIIEIFRFLVVVTFLVSFALFVLPTAYNTLIKQVFYPLVFS